MSTMTPSGAVIVGLGAFLQADTALMALADGRIWKGNVPLSVDYPFCSFQLQAGSGPEYSFTQEALNDNLFTVKGVDNVDGTTAEAIAARARVILKDAALTLGTGWQLEYCRPEGADKEMEEPNGSITFYHKIVSIRVKVSPA